MIFWLASDGSPDNAGFSVVPVGTTKSPTASWCGLTVFDSDCNADWSSICQSILGSNER